MKEGNLTKEINPRNTAMRRIRVHNQQILCSYHCTIERQKLMITPYGRYSFRRMPNGTSSASENFHKTINIIKEDLDGVHVFIDEIFIWVRTKEEHDRRL